MSLAVRSRFARATLLGLGLFVVYAAGASPTIFVGDSGELVAAAYRLGIPHPTGYPLYVLLGKLWSLCVPVGSIASRMSLFSAACAALAGAVMYAAARELELRWPAALLTALLLAFSPSLWAEANVQRVYALNASFVALATYTALRWHRENAPRWCAATFLVCGLGATNHMFMAVYAAAFVAAVGTRIAVCARRIGISSALRAVGMVSGAADANRPLSISPVAGIGNGGDGPWRGALRTLLWSLLGFIIGLLPYLYLPLRARAHPALNWGDPETLHRFLNVVLRRGFWGRAFYERPGDLLAIASDYLRSFAVELTWVGAALALIGLLGGRARAWPRLLFATVMFGNVAVMAIHGSRSDLFLWHRYYVPSYAMAALLAGCGCDLLLTYAPAALRVVPLAIPAVLLATGWRQFDRSRFAIADTYARAVLRSLPPGASLIATDDNILFALIYLTMVEDVRPDVNLIMQGVGAVERPPLHFNVETAPLFFTHHPNWHRPDLDIVPVGLVFEAIRAGHAPPPPTIPLWKLPGEDDAAVPKDELTRNLIGELHYMLGFTLARRDWQPAQDQFALAAAAAPDNDVLFYNLGLIYERNGLLDAARAAFERSRTINPRHVASGHAFAADRIAELDVERARIAAIERGLSGDPTLDTLAPGTPAYRLRLAALLEARGEARAARAQRLMARDQRADDGL